MQKMLAGLVRPLEWHEQTRDKGYVTGQWGALGFGGAYLITIYTTENDGCSLHLGHFDSDGQSHHPNLEAAKQAAYDDTCRRAAIALNPDAVLALVAAAYADAAKRITDISAYADVPGGLLIPNTFDEGTSAAYEMVVEATPTDATAALERMLADARAEGLEMAAAYCNGDEPGDFWPNLRAGIRAMKGEGA